MFCISPRFYRRTGVKLRYTAFILPSSIPTSSIPPFTRKRYNIEYLSSPLPPQYASLCNHHNLPYRKIPTNMYPIIFICPVFIHSTSQWDVTPTESMYSCDVKHRHPHIHIHIHITHHNHHSIHKTKSTHFDFLGGSFISFHFIHFISFHLGIFRCAYIADSALQHWVCKSSTQKVFAYPSSLLLSSPFVFVVILAQFLTHPYYKHTHETMHFFLYHNPPSFLFLHISLALAGFISHPFIPSDHFRMSEKDKYQNWTTNKSSLPLNALISSHRLAPSKQVLCIKYRIFELSLCVCMPIVYQRLTLPVWNPLCKFMNPL